MYVVINSEINTYHMVEFVLRVHGLYATLKVVIFYIYCNVHACTCSDLIGEWQAKVKHSLRGKL